MSKYPTSAEDAALEAGQRWCRANHAEDWGKSIDPYQGGAAAFFAGYRRGKLEVEKRIWDEIGNIWWETSRKELFQKLEEIVLNRDQENV